MFRSHTAFGAASVNVDRVVVDLDEALGDVGRALDRVGALDREPVGDRVRADVVLSAIWAAVAAV